MKKYTRLLALILALALCFALLAGCGDKPADSTEAPTESAESQPTEAPQDQPQDEPTEAPAEDPFANGVQYPLVADGEQVDLEIMCPLAGFMPLVMDDKGLNGTRGVQLMAEATGVNFYWMEIDQDAYGDQFNIMVTSGDYPDMVASPESYYNGGIDAVIDDGFCIDLVQYKDTYLKDYFDYCSGPEFETYIKRETSDTGKICTIWSLVESITMGMQIRKDWVDAVNMEIPETYDETYEVLKAIKNEFNVAPLCLTAGWSFGASSNTNLFTGGFETATGAQTNGELDWIVNEDGEAVACCIDDNFKEYLQLLNKWWSEGLICEDTLTIQNMQQITESLQQGKVGLWAGQTDMLTVDVDESFDAVPIANITREKGGTIRTGVFKGVRGNAGWAVTTSCKTPEIAAGVINWLWTEDGYIAANYGEEGVTFNYDENGDVVFTELITNNPNGFNPMFNSCSEILFFDFPFFYDLVRKGATFSSQKEFDSQTIWGSNETNELQYFGDLNTEESEIYSSLVGDIATYSAENISQFVTGAKSFDEWDAYVAQIEQLGIQQLIDVKTAAYQRYLQR